MTSTIVILREMKDFVFDFGVDFGVCVGVGVGFGSHRIESKTGNLESSKLVVSSNVFFCCCWDS